MTSMTVRPVGTAGKRSAGPTTGVGGTGVRGLRRLWPIYLAISPFYLLFLVFGLFPIVFSLYLSFHDWDGMGRMRYVGLGQYR